MSRTPKKTEATTADAGKRSEKDYLGKALDIGIHLTVVAVIIFTCLRIIGPFIMPVAWGIIIAVALHSIFEKMKTGLGGRNKLAGALFIILSLALVLAPTIWLADSLVSGASAIGEQLEEGKLIIPPPSDKVREWPLIGKPLYESWQSAHLDVDATVRKLAPQIRKLSAKFAALMGGLAGAVVQTILSLIIAGILMMYSTQGGRAARRIARRLGGDDGAAIVDISAATIRNVVKGVVMVSAIQGLMAAVGLVIAHVPGAGLWALLVMMIAVMQLPPILILGPIAVWVFSANDSTAVAVFFLIWSVIVSASDGFLKPLFLGRGVEVPMLVILIGAIGGMLSAGIIGLFVGAVVLAIGYQLITAWVDEDRAPNKALEETESA